MSKKWKLIQLAEWRCKWTRARHTEAETMSNLEQMNNIIIRAALCNLISRTCDLLFQLFWPINFVFLFPLLLRISALRFIRIVINFITWDVGSDSFGSVLWKLSLYCNQINNHQSIDDINPFNFSFHFFENIFELNMSEFNECSDRNVPTPLV